MKKILTAPIAAFALIMTLGAWPSLAVLPDEILADPGLETRARMISREIRCPVCAGESIDDSNAPISRDLRLIIRERLVAGDSNIEVIDYVVDRYGEVVLYNPKVSGVNWLLWLAGPAALLVLGAIGFGAIRRKPAAPAALSDAEEARLQELMKD